MKNNMSASCALVSICCMGGGLNAAALLGLSFKYIYVALRCLLLCELVINHCRDLDHVEQVVVARSPEGLLCGYELETEGQKEPNSSRRLYDL